MIVQEKIALDFAEFTLVKDNIVCVNHLNEDPLNVDKGIKIVKTVQKLSNGEPCAVILNYGDKYIFSTESNRFMASQIGKENHKFLARAIVTTNPASRIASNNFIKLLKPVVPTKLFSEIEPAMAWLEDVLSSEK